MNRIAGAFKSPLVFVVFLLSMLCAGTAAAQAWTKLSPTGGPPVARNNHVAAYNPVSNRMIVFGGYTNGFVNDTWVLSNADGSSGPQAWTQLVPAASSSVRDGATVGYNATSNRMVVFGGYGNSSPFNDVWVLTNADNSSGTPNWIQLNPSVPGGAPAARYRASAAYDAANNVLIVTDGWNGCCFNDVWVLSHADGTGGTTTWTQLNPTGTPPSARYGHTTVYDPATNELILFGGSDGSNYLNDTWVLSNANGTGGPPVWSPLGTSGGPPPVRGFHTAIYDSATNRMVVFGGAGGSLLNDVWALSNANGSGGTPTWSQFIPSGTAPTPRYVHTAVYNPTNNRMIVFDGSDGTSNVNEAWVLSSATGIVNIPVNIDIRPNTAINTISLSTGTEVPVAILSSASFDAPSQVDRTSLTFGHAGTEASFKSCNLRATDVNADGYKDLVCHFDGTKGGFMLGDTAGYLKGKTTAGNTISGSDSVNIIK